MARDDIPYWLRALNALARGSERVARGVSRMRNAAAVALVPPSRRSDITIAIFAREASYAPGGGMFERGLMQWEEEMLGPPFPQSGRVLVCAAGCGRECVALRDRGYEILAFDPAESLVRAGAPVLAARAIELRAAGYEDLVRAARGDPSPLADVASFDFDAVLLGWNSFALVLENVDRRAILQALRQLAPRATVALSFPEPTERVSPRYPDHGGTASNESEICFNPWTGFFRESSLGEVALMAREAGYDPTKLASAPGRMLLMPASGGAQNP
jgi:hypothetical protein